MDIRKEYPFLCLYRAIKKTSLRRKKSLCCYTIRLLRHVNMENCLDTDKIH